ncbi:hypothetical protein A7A69_04245 [Acinetobacter sp. Ac_1271]|nr:hypothetical protein [Acinetobacter guerrae]
MKRYLLLICLIVSNCCFADSNTPGLQSSCERLSVQAEKIMERRQAGVTLNDEKESIRNFLDFHEFNSKNSKSEFEKFMNIILIEAYRENIKDNDFAKEMMISGFRQRIFYKCLSGEIFDGLI